MRRPSFAGSFYEADPVRLDAQIKACFTHPLGPGGLPVPPKDLPMRAVVVPHAGYIFSGPCAAWAYKALAEAPLPDVVVVAGPNHSAPASGLTLEPVEMPFGFVRVDQELAHELAAREHIAVNEDIDVDNADGLLWAMAYRMNPIEDVQLLPHRGQGHEPQGLTLGNVSLPCKAGPSPAVSSLNERKR